MRLLDVHSISQQTSDTTSQRMPLFRFFSLSSFGVGACRALVLFMESTEFGEPHEMCWRWDLGIFVRATVCGAEFLHTHM